MMAKLQAQVLVRKLQGLIDAAFARRARGPAAHALRTALPPHCITRRCGTDTAEPVAAASPKPTLTPTLTLTLASPPPTPTRMRSPAEHPGPHPLARILEYLDELRSRGCFGGDRQQGAAPAKLPLPALLEQVARLRPGEARAGRSVAERAFTVLTERWLATALIDAARLDAATARISAADGAARDAAVLAELVSLAAPPAPRQHGEEGRREDECTLTVPR